VSRVLQSSWVRDCSFPQRPRRPTVLSFFLLETPSGQRRSLAREFTPHAVTACLTPRSTRSPPSTASYAGGCGCLPRSRRRLGAGPAGGRVAATAAAASRARTLARTASKRDHGAPALSAGAGGASGAGSTPHGGARHVCAAAATREVAAAQTSAANPGGSWRPGSGTVSAPSGTRVAGWKPKSNLRRAYTRKPRVCPGHGFARLRALAHE
jgi:hypothetical protein